MMKEFVIKENVCELTGEKVAPLLRPQDLILGSWSVENEQITCHLSGQDPWEAKVFSLKRTEETGVEELEMPLFMKSKSSEVKIDKARKGGKDAGS